MERLHSCACGHHNPCSNCGKTSVFDEYKCYKCAKLLGETLDEWWVVANEERLRKEAEREEARKQRPDESNGMYIRRLLLNKK